MNRFLLIWGLGLGGFLLGFSGYLIASYFPFIFGFILANPESVRALASGVMGSILSTSTLIIWERIKR